jgi:Mn2+/Fe2+ NRAMP family transporter
MSENSFNEIIPKDSSRISRPPRSLKEFMRYMGPAWIFTASQIGGGEALTVPLIAAYLGMDGFWLVPLVAFTKIFGQYYLVQYGVISGNTILDSLWRKKWLIWFFYWIMAGALFHSLGLTGHLAETAGAFNYLFPVNIQFWIIVTMLLGLIIVITRSYNLVEIISTILLWPFLFMITIVAILVWPTFPELLMGLKIGLPGTVEPLGGGGWFVIALSFGWIGAGFGPTISYVWFAKDKIMGMFEIKEHSKPLNLNKSEIENLQGWRDVIFWQNVISSILLSVFSMMIWIASAQTLHKLNVRPSGFEVLPQMAQIFTSIYGDWSGIIFLLSIMTALFSSIIGPLYGLSRLWEDAFEIQGFFKKFKINSIWVFRANVILFALIPLVFSLLTTKPMFLFAISGVLFSPIIGLMYIASIWMSFENIDRRLRPKRWWAIILGLFAAIMTILSSLVELF